VTTLPEPLLRLIDSLKGLPGIGPRSAERIALHLVQTDPQTSATLAEAAVQARAAIQACERCGGLTESQPCQICDDPRRDTAILCVVERPEDVLALEKSRAFTGLYHVLGGKLSPMNGVGPEDLRIGQLETRLKQEAISEVIIALGTDVEGDATSFYLAKSLAAHGITVSRIAFGLPAGAGLEFADEVTLSRAMEGRREMEK